MIWKQQQAYSEHRTQRILSGNTKVNEHRSNLHSPRNSQNYNKDTFIGLQKISKDIVESLTKALTPNHKVRQISPQQPKEQEKIQQLKINSQHESTRQPLESISNKIDVQGYINFTKLARKISQQPIKNIQVIKTRQKMSRQKSEDFHSKQEQWLKKKNEKVLKQRIEKQCEQCRSENKMTFIEKSQTDRFQ